MPSAGRSIATRQQQEQQQRHVLARPESARAASSKTTKLQRLQEEVAAKARGKAPASAASQKRSPSGSKEQEESPSLAFPRSSYTAVKRLNRMEADIAAKERARVGRASLGTARSKEAATTTPHGPSSSTTSGATTTITKRLDRMQADIAAKAEARAAGRARGVALRRNQQGTNSSSSSSSSTNTNNSGNKSKTRADAIAMKLAKARATNHTQGAKIPGAVSSKSGTDDGMGPKKKEAMASAFASSTGTGVSGSGDGAKLRHLQKSGPFTDPRHPLNGTDSGNGEEGYGENVLVEGGDSPFQIAGGHGGFNGTDKSDGVAVAVAVNEDNLENVFIPSAVEYDPDAKLPVYKSQRFRVYGIMSCILLIVIAACAIGVLAIIEANNNSQDDPGYPPTEPPTCSRCTMDYIEQLELEVGEQKLKDPDSPEYRAKEWIIHEDELELLPTNGNFIQRFLLATFYFDTHRSGNWRSCNQDRSQDPDEHKSDSEESEQPEDCTFLKVNRIEPLDFEGVQAKRWLSPATECLWAGVTCDESKNIRKVSLYGQDIRGTFPDSFANLKYVQTIGMHWNNFNGTLPENLGKMKHLIHVELHNNLFTGGFPSSWSNARNFQLLNIANNFLTGQLPATLGNFRNIKGLFLYKNQFSGTLPSELANARSLAFVRFHKNAFSGTIPPEYGEMQLNELWLQGNTNLTGTIPPELGKLSNYLTDLRLGTTSLEGTVPEALYDMSQMWRLDFSGSGFTGTISPNITKLQSMQTLRLNNNAFTGTVPDLSAMTNLVTLWLHGNDITGFVPPNTCDLRETHMLRDVIVDCVPEADPLAAEEVYMTCRCCDICCTPGTNACGRPPA